MFILYAIASFLMALVGVGLTLYTFDNIRKPKERRTVLTLWFIIALAVAIYKTVFR